MMMMMMMMIACLNMNIQCTKWLWLITGGFGYVPCGPLKCLAWLEKFWWLMVCGVRI